MVPPALFLPLPIACRFLLLFFYLLPTAFSHCLLFSFAACLPARCQMPLGTSFYFLAPRAYYSVDYKNKQATVAYCHKQNVCKLCLSLLSVLNVCCSLNRLPTCLLPSIPKAVCLSSVYYCLQSACYLWPTEHVRAACFPLLFMFVKLVLLITFLVLF
jgi:hypothetical protein